MSAAFAQTWTARVLTAPPLIAPARQFVYPQRIAGEEDAMARGALLLDVKPATPRCPAASSRAHAPTICSPWPAATRTSSTPSHRSAACICRCAL